MLSRLRVLHLWIIWLVIAIGIGVLGYIGLVMPQQKTLASLHKRTAQEQEQADTKLEVQANLERAHDAKRDAQAAWKRVMAQKMPDISVKEPLQAMFALWREQGPQGETGSKVYAFLRGTGVQFSGLSIPAAPITPPDASQEVLTFPQTLAVNAKSFPAFLDFLRKLPQSPRMLVIGDSLTLNAAEGGVSTSVPLTMYVFLKGIKVAAPPAAEGEGAAEGMGAPMMGGPGGGGMPGRGGMMGRMGGPGGGGPGGGMPARGGGMMGPGGGMPARGGGMGPGG